MFQCSTFTLLVARAEKSNERVVSRQPALQSVPLKELR